MSRLKDYEFFIAKFKDYDKYHEIKLEEINKQYEENGLEKIELEEFNFKVDSSDWEIKEVGWCTVKVNPEWDIFEYVYSWDEEGCKDTTWEQLFTRDAAMRETEKVGKRIPTDEELTYILANNSDISNWIYPWMLADEARRWNDLELYYEKDFKFRYRLISFWTTTKMLNWPYDCRSWCKCLSRDHNWFISFCALEDIWISVRCIKK